MKALGVFVASVITALGLAALVIWFRSTSVQLEPLPKAVDDFGPVPRESVVAKLADQPIPPLASPQQPPAPTQVAAVSDTSVSNVPVLAPVARRESTTAMPPAVDTGSKSQIYVFWKPFNSRASAQGFAGVLEERASVPVRVVAESKVGGRQYRLALPFANEIERQARLADLEAATGFEFQ